MTGGSNGLSQGSTRVLCRGSTSTYGNELLLFKDVVRLQGFCPGSSWGVRIRGKIWNQGSPP